MMFKKTFRGRIQVSNFDLFFPHDQSLSFLVYVRTSGYVHQFSLIGYQIKKAT